MQNNKNKKAKRDFIASTNSIFMKRQLLINMGTSQILGRGASSAQRQYYYNKQRTWKHHTHNLRNTVFWTRPFVYLVLSR